MEINITKDNFEKEVLYSELPVVLDFWASWCGPCRMLAPVLAEKAEKYSSLFKVGKVNTDEEPELASAFEISSIPTLVFIRGGKTLGTSCGYMNGDRLEEVLAKAGIIK